MSLANIKRVEDALNYIVSEIQKEIGEDIFNISDFYFAGGCIYCLWNNKEVKDYDIFCTNRKALNKLKNYFKSNKDKYNIKTQNAITMGKYQFVIKHVGEPEVEVNKFDFKHNMFYYNDSGLHNLADWGKLDSNNLEYNSERARDILNIITRIPKFVDRGMEISQVEILNILEQGTKPTKYFSERKSIIKRIKGKIVY